MAEKRNAPRKKKRLIVDFDVETADSQAAGRTTGFTHDISRSGLFVRTIRIPQIGRTLNAVLHLPQGKQVAIQGKVVRSFRAPASLRYVVPSGFGLRLYREGSPGYDEFTASIEDKAKSA